MCYITKKLELPVNENGETILTAEAIKLIKKCRSLVARWHKTDESKCFFRICLETTVEGETVYIHYDMPINTRGNHSNAFSGHFDNYNHKGIPAFIALLKPGCVVFFGGDTGGSTNTNNAGLVWDRVNYSILMPNNKQFVYGLFEESLTPAMSMARLTYEY